MFGEAQLNALDGISFLTDRDATILEVGTKRWNAFAAENGAPTLTNETVVGHNLFEFVAGADNCAHLRHVLDSLAGGRYDSWVMPFRCDAPDRQRNMRQAVTACTSGRICSAFLFQSIELDAHQRPPIELFDFQGMVRRAEQETGLPLVNMCSWCQRVRYPPLTGEVWLEPEQYYAIGGNSHVKISHGICLPCREKIEHSFR